MLVLKKKKKSNISVKDSSDSVSAKLTSSQIYALIAFFGIWGRATWVLFRWHCRTEGEHKPHVWPDKLPLHLFTQASATSSEVRSLKGDRAGVRPQGPLTVSWWLLLERGTTIHSPQLLLYNVTPWKSWKSDGWNDCIFYEPWFQFL